MSHSFRHLVVDLDQTLADSACIKKEQDEAGYDWLKRPALHEKIIHVKEFPGAAKLLTTFKKRGGKVIILTNSWQAYAQKMVKHLGFEVDEIIASAGKPNRGSLARIRDNYDREHLGKNVVHAGDSAAKDLRESVAANVGFILCLWGELQGKPHQPRHDEKNILLKQVNDIPELHSFLIP